jgi:predicted RNA-binding protein with PIN domain
MPHDFATAAAVVADPTIQRREREPARRRAGDERMKAPAASIDLDDVSRVDPLQSHCRAHGGIRPPPGAETTLDGVRWFVDGMNVIGTRPDAWWRDRHAAMVGLVHMLENWVAATGEDVVVVFEQPPRPPISSTVIEVAHAPRPRRDSADDEIVRRVAAEQSPGEIRVVTSDLWLVDRVRAAGATVQAADAFRAWIEES